jgi:hypothetical protein
VQPEGNNLIGLSLSSELTAANNDGHDRQRSCKSTAAPKAIGQYVEALDFEYEPAGPLYLRTRSLLGPAVIQEMPPES